jgi:hypothetical protein
MLCQKINTILNYFLGRKRGGRREMNVAPKKEVAELKAPPFEQQVENILRNDPDHAYHTTRVKEEDLASSFAEWKDKKAINLWRKVRNALVSLEQQDKVNKRREGKVNYYWWKKERGEERK